VTVPVSELEPVPAIDCGVCDALGKERAEARRAGDLMEVAKMNAEIRNHPHRRTRPRSRLHREERS
jgi:hypothetical protein